MMLPTVRRRIGALTVLAGALAAPAALGAPSAAADAALRVHTTRLPGLPGAHGSTEAHAVNAAGVVAGAATTAGGALHAVVWVRGAVLDLDRGRAVSADTARGINSAGDVVGEDQSLGRFHARAVLWRDGRRTVLPAPPPPPSDFLYGCFASAVDDAGLVGGYCEVDINSSVNSMPVLWRDGVPSVPWSWGRVSAIGSAGRLAGRYEPGFDGDVLQAVLDSGSGFRVLPPLVAGSTQDQALGVNGQDVAVGESGGRPVRWSGGSAVALPAPSGTGVAYGINRWGTAVGAEGLVPRPVAWKQGALVPLAAARGAAVAVGDRGTAVGWTETAAGVRTAVRWQL